MTSDSTNALQRKPLKDLYARLMRETVGPDMLISIIERRSELAAHMYALSVADLSQQDLDAMRDVLTPALEENPDADIAEDATEREFVRVQLEAVEQEIERRSQFIAKAKTGEQEAPARTELMAWMLRLGTGMEEDGEKAEFHATFQEITQLIRRAPLDYPAGAQRVAGILREVEALPSEGRQPKMEPWLRGMILSYSRHLEWGSCPAQCV